MLFSKNGEHESHVRGAKIKSTRLENDAVN